MFGGFLLGVPVGAHLGIALTPGVVHTFSWKTSVALVQTAGPGAAGLSLTGRF